MRRRDLVSAVLAIAALAVAVLVVGSAYRWTQALVALLVAAALVPQLLSRHTFVRISPLLALIGAALALTALQLVPLSLLAHLNPTGDGLRADGAALLGFDTSSIASLDSAGTIRGLSYFVILSAVATLGLRLSTSERGRYHVLAVVAALAGVTSVLVGVHSLFGATSLYGVFEPQRADPVLLGPLLNTNHLGCLTAIGACISLGLAMYTSQPNWRRVMWLVVTGACGACTMSTMSRGAALALIAGGVVTLAAAFGQRLVGTDDQRRRHARFLRNSLPIGLVAICTVVIVIYSSAGGVSRQLDSTSLGEIHAPKSKFAAWRSTAALVEESPWIGVGRGGFESSFTRFHPAAGLLTFSHVENEYIQAVVDWGIPGALVLGVFAIWGATVALRRWREGPLAAAALGGLAVVAIQSNVDFGIELLGIAVPLTAIASTMTYVPLRVVEGRRLAGARGFRVLHILALGSVAWLLFSSITTTVDEDHARLRSRSPLTLVEINASLERHPLDYYGYSLAADLMIRTGDPRAVAVINHALILHPTHPGLHHLVAQLLYRTGHLEQAAVEYEATIRGTTAIQPLIAEIVSLFPTDLAAAAIPSDFTDLTGILAALGQHSAVATAWLSRVLERRPHDARACDLLYGISLSRGDLRAAEIAGRKCVEIMPDHQTRLALATVLSHQHGYAETIRLLRDIDMWEGRTDAKVNGWLTLCDAYAGLSLWDEARKCLHHLEASGDVTPELRPIILQRLEEIQKQNAAHDLDVDPASPKGRALLEKLHTPEP